MNVAELDDDCQKNSDSDEFQTPTNLSSTNLVKFNLGPDEISGQNETEDEQDITINETINYTSETRPNLINSYSNSMPQFPINHFPNSNMNLHNPYIHHGATNANFNSYFPLPYHPIDQCIYKNFDDKENQRRAVFGLYNDLKLSQYGFHSLETFSFFIRYTLNLSPEMCKEVLTNHKILHWLDRNKADGFVYHTLPKFDETKQRMAPIRCELCKFYGHLSHSCSIKEQSFKLYNVALKSGACRCHICGQLGHPAEAGLCMYISCSFCRKYGHWNHMCPNIDKVSRTLCHKCQRYGHTTERCPDQWRQFDRISTLEQTPYKDPSETNKPVYCYQCAKQGHYGHNCPDFYRKYFIRDNHQLNPVYFFAGSSPFVKNAVELNESDKKLIEHLTDRPIEDVFKSENPEQDPLEMLEKFQTKLRQETNLPPQVLFNELLSSTQMNSNNIGFKKYIRRWSNWVIDFNWIYSLKFFLEILHENKMFYLVKNYPILDNFILHWMWWSYSLNKDMEFYTKDAFRGVGSMPWLINDDINNNNKKKKNLNKKKKSKKAKKIERKKVKRFNYNPLNTDLFDTEHFRAILHKRSISMNDLMYEKESQKFCNEKKCSKYGETICELKQNWSDLNQRDFKYSTLTREKSKSIDFSELSELKIQESTDEEVQDDLEITIVYLDKDKTKSKSDDARQTEIANHETSVFDKFLKSFSSGQITSSEEIKKENSFNKLIDFLKSSSKTKEEQGLVVRVSDYTENAPVLDSAPTVEQIETEIFGSKPSTDSADLIKLLLKIDKNPIKIPNLNPPIFDILKSSVNSQADSCMNKMLTTPINVDIVSQLTCSSSSSGFSSSSISPQPLSSNPSPNSSSSNSSTAKPNQDSSFSTSCSSKSQVSTSSLSLSSSSSSVSIDSNGTKQAEKLKEEIVSTAQKETKCEENDKIMNQSKNSKFKSSKNNYNKMNYQKSQMSRVSGTGGYQNRSFSKQQNFPHSNVKHQQYSNNFRAQQYQNRQFLNVQSKFPKSNSLPSNGKYSNPFSNNYMYSMPKATNSSIGHTSQSLHWQPNFVINNSGEQNNQFNFQSYKNVKFRNQFSNSSQSLRGGVGGGNNNNEKKSDYNREHNTLMPLIPFQNMYSNSTSSSNSSTPASASFSSNASTPNNFALPKPTTNLMHTFYKKPQSTTNTAQMGPMSQRQQPMGYNNAKKNVKK